MREGERERGGEGREGEGGREGGRGREREGEGGREGKEGGRERPYLPIKGFNGASSYKNAHSIGKNFSVVASDSIMENTSAVSISQAR